ncbi:hypothetical protein PG984_006469 [Apiospora sp. TS-2023a]
MPIFSDLTDSRRQIRELDGAMCMPQHHVLGTGLLFKRDTLEAPTTSPMSLAEGNRRNKLLLACRPCVCASPMNQP